MFCQGIWVNVAYVFSVDPTLRAMWPDGQQDITEVTKRPLTAGTLFKNSMVALVENLASKVFPFKSFSVPWHTSWRAFLFSLLEP